MLIKVNNASNLLLNTQPIKVDNNHSNHDKCSLFYEWTTGARHGLVPKITDRTPSPPIPRRRTLTWKQKTACFQRKCGFTVPFFFQRGHAIRFHAGRSVVLGHVFFFFQAPPRSARLQGLDVWSDGVKEELFGRKNYIYI